MLRASAKWVAGRDSLPASLRAVMGYYADTGVFDAGSLRLKRRVDAVTEQILDDAFGAIETAVATEFERDAVSFEYDTKLVLPAKLTLGHLYRELEEDEHPGVEAMTRLAIEALVDGDMRDAINDDEFEDFAVDFPVDESDRRRIAHLAQQTLQERVDRQFADQPDAVRSAYDWAVDISEAHQDDDDYFRRLMAAARGGDDDFDAETPRSDDANFDAEMPGGGDANFDAERARDADADFDAETARERIRSEYKYAEFDEMPEIFRTEERDLPYLKTQYDRVGVIYDGMVRMYRAGGFPVEDTFARSIVLAIVGAQVWLDDVDDYTADMREGQLTPVTAEYILADDVNAAYDSIVAISERYIDLSKSGARTVESPLTGIAAEYIYRSGSPESLPP